MADRSSGDQSAPLSFDNGNTAWRVEERPGDDPRALIDLLGLGSAPHPVLVVCGGADGMTDDQLDRAGEVLGPAVARAAGARGATVVDGGTDAGVMRVIGEARSEDRRAMPVLVGVSPRGKVREPGEPADKRTELQRNHSHFVFADSARWGGETPLLFDVAAGLSAHLPAVVVLANGETHSRGEALEAVRRGWPLVLVEGLGGLADEVVAISRLSKRARGDADPVLCRLAEYDRLAICDGEDVLADCLAWELSDQPVLMSAWGMFAAYDKRADGLQKAFIRLQRVIILIGIVVTGLALLHGATSGAGERAVHWAASAGSSCASRRLRGCVPWMRVASAPLRKRIIVGIARMPKLAGVSMFSSMFSFTIRRSSRSAAISSRIGAMTRQGPHHGAQKSTSTGLSDSRTSAWKVVSVTSVMLPAIRFRAPLRASSLQKV